MNEKLLHNRYEPLESLGTGGEARVMRARDVESGRDVAVRLPLHRGTISSSGTIPAQHPGWVQLFDSGVDPEQGAYQIMELLEGPTLSQLIKSGPLPSDSWRLFVEQSLAAVEALHQADWIHGDLNADNFIRSGSREGCWKLLEPSTLFCALLRPQADFRTLRQHPYPRPGTAQR